MQPAFVDCIQHLVHTTVHHQECCTLARSKYGCASTRRSLSTCNESGFAYPGAHTMGWHTALQTQSSPCSFGLAPMISDRSTKKVVWYYCATKSIGTVAALSGISTVADQKQQSGAGRNRAHRLVPVRLFCWLLTRRATGEQTRSCSRAESGYARRNKVEASARCVPGLSFSLAFNTGSNSGAQRALPSAFVAPLSFCPNRLGRKGAPGVNLDCRFDLLLTRGPNRVHRRRCCRAESRYARRNRSEASARCVPRLSFLLAFNTGSNSGAPKALRSGQVAICEAEIDPVGWGRPV